MIQSSHGGLGLVDELLDLLKACEHLIIWALIITWNPRGIFTIKLLRNKGGSMGFRVGTLEKGHKVDGEVLLRVTSTIVRI